MTWQRFFKRKRLEQQLDRELQFHVEQLTREYMASGLSEDEARRQAKALFGSTPSIKEEVRDAWGCGIRMALGARRHAVNGMVIRESLVPVASGIVIGSITALVLARWVE